jgi:hypothetical protein
MISREDKIRLYTMLVETKPGAELKGDTVPYTSLNGHMYSYLSKENVLALRLPKTVLGEFLEKYKTTLMTAYGIVQKEYAIVPDSLLADTAQLAPWFEQSYDHISTLKPKPTTKKKA